jgi:uncharacterized protein (TIRG00374 family)
MNRTLRFVLLGLGLLVLVGFVTRLDLTGSLSALRTADPARLALAVLLLAANVSTKALRWQVMARRLSDQPLRWPAAGAAILAGVAAASLAPGRTVELAKPLLLRSSHGVPMASSTAGVVVERLLDGAALAILFAGSLVFVPPARLSVFYPALAAIALFLVLGAVLLLLPHRLAAAATWVTTRLPLPAEARARTASIARRFATALATWRERKMLGGLLALSVLAALLEGVRLAIVCAAFGLGVGVPEALLAFSAANLLAAVTFIPGGIGVTEVSLTGLLALVAGVGPQGALGAAVLTDRTLSYYLVVALGGLVLIAAARRPPRDADVPGGR